MVKSAMREFRDGFGDLDGVARDQSGRQALNEAVLDYYENAFAAEYASRNGDSAGSTGLFPEDPLTLAAQYVYIAANPHPLGGKDALRRDAADVPYNRAHERYHPIFRELIQRFGYYDLFLIEPTEGRIVYSVFKELGLRHQIVQRPVQ